MKTPTFEEMEGVNKLLRLALLSENDGEKLNAIKGAAKRIRTHGLDPHQVGAGRAYQAVLKPERERLKAFADGWRNRAEELQTALHLEKQTSASLLATITGYLARHRYTDGSYADQSDVGGAERRWAKRGEALELLHRYMKKSRVAEAELADLRSKLLALATEASHEVA